MEHFIDKKKLMQCSETVQKSRKEDIEQFFVCWLATWGWLKGEMTQL